jgi:hypothetical protein
LISIHYCCEYYDLWILKHESITVGSGNDIEP